MSYLHQHQGGEVVVSVDETTPNIIYLDRDAPTMLIQINCHRYEVRQGLRLLGIATFFNGSQSWGWRYRPHSANRNPSRKLHPDVQSSLRGRVQFDIFLPQSVLCSDDVAV